MKNKNRVIARDLNWSAVSDRTYFPQVTCQQSFHTSELQLPPDLPYKL